MESGYLASGYVAATSRPEEFGAFVKEEIAKWSRVIRDAGIQAN